MDNMEKILAELKAEAEMKAAQLKPNINFSK
jgi:hypothetical protein